MRPPERGHGWKRVQNVAHGAEAHHEQAIVVLRVQDSIFAQRQVFGLSFQAGALTRLSR
jgi:hypothetical protein